jgi:hypothetical protein
MILNVNAGFATPNNGKITTAFNGAVSETVADKIATNEKKPKETNTTTSFESTLNPQAGWSKIVKSSLEGGSFAGYVTYMEETPPTATKKTGKNTLWKQIIAEAAKGSGLSTSKPSAGGDAFAKGYSADLTSSSVDDSEG